MAAERIGRYALQAEVARGGMGVVHRALDPAGRTVALKLLLAGRHASPQQRARVATEIQSLLRIRHPNVVALLDAGEHQGVPYLVTEWVAGETLAGLLERSGPLEPGEAVRLVQALCAALSHCHAQGVLHRDLKPENVLLRGAERHPLLVDFGLSKDVASDSRASIHGTVAGLWLGTPGYWPPEQGRGQLSAVGPRSDVYGLGAVLYAALTARAPQEGTSFMELARSIDEPVAPPSRWRAGIPPEVEAVCLRALSIDPAARQAGPDELARELARAGGAARTWTTLLAAALVVVAAAAAAATIALSRSREPGHAVAVVSSATAGRGRGRRAGPRACARGQRRSRRRARGL